MRTNYSCLEREFGAMDAQAGVTRGVRRRTIETLSGECRSKPFGLTVNTVKPDTSDDPPHNGAKCIKVVGRVMQCCQHLNAEAERSSRERNAVPHRLPRALLRGFVRRVFRGKQAPHRATTPQYPKEHEGS